MLEILACWIYKGLLSSIKNLRQDKDDNWAIATSTLEDLEDLASTSTPYLKSYFTRQVIQIRAHILLCEKQEREEMQKLFLLERQRLEKARLEEEERLAEEERQRFILEKLERNRLEKEALLAKFKNRPKRVAKINYFLPEDELNYDSGPIDCEIGQENVLSTANILESVTEKLSVQPQTDALLSFDKNDITS